LSILRGSRAIDAIHIMGKKTVARTARRKSCKPIWRRIGYRLDNEGLRCACYPIIHQCDNQEDKENHEAESSCHSVKSLLKNQFECLCD
jgi:hypothetical protein